jgi:hypothetical protein
LPPPKKIPNMKIKPGLFTAFLLFIISCKKNETANMRQPDIYLTTSTGSTWNYRETDSSGAAPVTSHYTLTSTSKDSSIGGKSYHIFSSSTGGNQYLNVTGNDYYQFDSLPETLGAVVFEMLYLKDNAAVGISWSQNLNVTLPGIPIPVPVTLTYNIVETGISRTVNGTSYTDVIHVATSISSAFIPAASLTTNINSYYAKKYGLIETSNIIVINFMGVIQNINLETKLVSAALL